MLHHNNVDLALLSPRRRFTERNRLFPSDEATWQTGDWCLYLYPSIVTRHARSLAIACW